MIEQFAEAALQAEQLGQRGVTDILAVSFSANDYVGHANGPDSPEVHEVSLQTDKVLDKLFQALDQSVGMDNVLVVMTADHGVAPLPETNAARKMPGGRLPLGTVSKDRAGGAGEEIWRGQLDCQQLRTFGLSQSGFDCEEERCRGKTWTARQPKLRGRFPMCSASTPASN